MRTKKNINPKKRRTLKRNSWEPEVNSVIAELSISLLSPASMEDISSLVLKHAKSLTGSKFGYVGYIDPATGYLVSTTMIRDIWEDCKIKDKEIIFKEFKGLWGWVLNNRKPILTNNPADDPRSSGTPQGHMPICRFLSVPALINENLVGQISLANSDHDYTGNELAIIERLASLLAIAIHRNRTENDLIESEQKYRTLVENINIGIYRNTAGTHGRFLQVNPAMFKMFGYDSAEEFMMISSADFYQNAIDRQQFVEKIQKQGFVKNEEIKLRRKDGVPILGSVTAKAQYNEKGKIKWIDGVIEDITKRKLSEERLVQSLETLQSVYNIATTLRGSHEAVYDQVVYNLSSLLRISYVAVQHIEEDQIKIISRIIDGKFIHNEISSLEHTPCAIVSEKKETLQIKGRLDHIFPGSKLLSEHKFRTHIGVPIRNISGKVVGFLCAMDYEERTFTEDEIRLIEIFARYVAYEFERNVMETQLRQLDRMKILGQMAAGVAHEVRNPLNAILAITEALFQDIGDNPEYKPFLDHIRTQVDRLSRLMGDLLDLGKPIQPSSLHQEFIPSICTATMDLWKQIPLSKTHKVRLVLPDHSSNLTVMADSSRLQQVLLNLLENAAQHSPEGSEIQIIVSNPKGITVRIDIVDQGAGLPAENFLKVFEPFFTTRKRGNGLGLSLAKNTILAHGGNIGIKNNDPPPGCTVKISLPVLQEVEQLNPKYS